MEEMIIFANADLEILSKTDLKPFRDNLIKWGDLFSEMTCQKLPDGDFFARFEINIEPKEHTASNLIEAFCDNIERLDGLNFETWKQASSRIIDLGYVGADNCPAFNDLIGSKILKRMVVHDIDLAISLYPPTIKNPPSN